MFKGCITALVTPFKNNQLDLEAVEKLVTYQLAEGVDGLVVCGTTGEAPTLSFDEKTDLFTTVIKTVNKRVPVIIGASSASTTESVKFASQAEQLGANGILVVPPYYNKPTQEGIYKHFETISSNTSLPIIIYNIPGRVVVNASDSTIARIAKLKNICALKDSTGDLTRPLSLATYEIKKGFSLLSGDDITAIAFNANGGCGVISVTSNILPRACSEIQKLCLNDQYKEALERHKQLVPIHLALFCETNPVPIKYALHLLGFISDEVRLPLVELQEESKIKIKSALKQLKLI